MKTAREIANNILTTGQNGYKTREEGFRISDEMTILINQYVTQEVNLALQEAAKKANLHVVDNFLANPEAEIKDVHNYDRFYVTVNKNSILSLQRK